LTTRSIRCGAFASDESMMIPGTSKIASVRGAGELVLLFIPGLIGRAEDWDPVRARLDDSFITSSYDPAISSGLSNAEDGRWTLEGAVAELQDVVASLPPAPLVVIGTSMGGMVALAWAASGGRAAAVITVGTSPRWLSGAEWPFGPDQESASALIAGLRSDFTGTFNNLLPVIWTNDDASGEVTALYRARVAGIENPLPIVDTLEEVYTLDLRPRLHSCEAPVLLLHGEMDALLPVAVAEAIRPMLRDAAVEIIPGAGHLAPLTARSAIASAIEHFIDARVASEARP
jgi:pimeloyl-[acyl-carrier protein] methyl ester esterase